MGRHLRLRYHLVRVRHREVNDPPRLAGLHARRHRLAHVKDGMEVVSEHRGPAGRRLIQDVDAVIGPGAVDESVHRAELLFDFARESFARRRIGDVAPLGERAPTGLRDARRGLCGLALRRPVAQGDVPPRRGEVQADRAADSLRPTCDQRHSSHRLLLRSPLTLPSPGHPLLL